MKNTNSSIICTWSQDPDCVACELQGKLNCRWDARLLRFFLLNQVPSLALAFFGIVLIGVIVGIWWTLIAYSIACVALWGLGIETRLLCSHCPYYAENSKILHCQALYGSPKIWRYRPEPMNRVEKTTLILFFLFILLFPVIVEAYGIWYIFTNYTLIGLFALLGMIGVTIATVMAELQFLYILMRDFCSRCVNFSCPTNSVPKSMVDAYLDKNPVMKEAWLRSGYKPG